MYNSLTRLFPFYSEVIEAQSGVMTCPRPPQLEMAEPRSESWQVVVDSVPVSYCCCPSPLFSELPHSSEFWTSNCLRDFLRLIYSLTPKVKFYSSFILIESSNRIEGSFYFRIWGFFRMGGYQRRKASLRGVVGSVWETLHFYGIGQGYIKVKIDLNTFKRFSLFWRKTFTIQGSVSVLKCYNMCLEVQEVQPVIRIVGIRSDIRGGFLRNKAQFLGFCFKIR